MTPDEFVRYLHRLAASIPKQHQEMVAELAGWAIHEAVERSPVRTGAYRASHTVTRGDAGSGPGAVVYEGKDRVGDNERVADFPRDRYEPANGRDAEAAVRRVEPFTRIEIRNGRYYASMIEFGTPSMAPRAIYGAVESLTEARAQRLAQRGFEGERI